MNTTQKWLLGICILLSVCALVLSIVATCRTCARTLGIDYLGVIVGVLALIVTILLGWQIFQIINLKSTESSIKSMLNESARDTYKALAHLHANIAVSVASNNRFDYLLHNIMRIVYNSKSGNFAECERLIKGLEHSLPTQNPPTSKGEMLNYALNQIEHKEKISNISELEDLITKFIEHHKAILFPTPQSNGE